MTESPTRRILVATDFSTRSDRAIRRASLLARQMSAELVLVHVIDDDRPRRLVTAEQREASALLDELAITTRSLDGVPCRQEVHLGEAFEGILRAAGEIDADLIVMGMHRRELLRDIFIGTTIERVIREGRRPVLMANMVPAGNYHSVLIAVDLSPPSANAARTALSLGLLSGASTTLLYAFEAPATAMMTRASMTKEQIDRYVAEEETAAKRELARFADETGLTVSRSLVRHAAMSDAYTILAGARDDSAQLVVLGTRGRTGVARLLLGSVAQEVLRLAPQDVLIVPDADQAQRPGG